MDIEFDDSFNDEPDLRLTLAKFAKYANASLGDIKLVRFNLDFTLVSITVVTRWVSSTKGRLTVQTRFVRHMFDDANIMQVYLDDIPNLIQELIADEPELIYDY